MSPIVQQLRETADRIEAIERLPLPTAKTFLEGWGQAAQMVEGRLEMSIELSRWSGSEKTSVEVKIWDGNTWSNGPTVAAAVAKLQAKLSPAPEVNPADVIAEALPDEPLTTAAA